MAFALGEFALELHLFGIGELIEMNLQKSSAYFLDLFLNSSNPRSNSMSIIFG